MTDQRKQQKTSRRPEAGGGKRPYGLRPIASGLLALSLCILALRVTYTEAPVAQTMTLAGSLTDTIYSLTLSGLLIFAFVAWIVYRLATGRPVYRVTGMEIGLILFGAAAVLASLGASDKRAAINHTTILLAPLFAALLLAQILDSPGQIRMVSIVVVALGIVSAYQCAEQFLVSNAITIEQYEKDPNILLGPLGIEAGTFQHFLFEHRLYSRGIRGFFTTSNSAASFAICAAFAAIALLAWRLQGIRGDKRALRYAVFTLAAVTLIAAGLLLTQSKGGIVAFLAGLAIFGLLTIIDRRFPAQKHRILTILIPLVLLLVGATICAAVLYGLRHGRLPGGNSMLVRWQYWTASAQMVADHPLAGVGPGNFSDYYPHYKPAAALESVADPHNWPLSLITQYGPLGLLGFLAMLWVPLWRSVMSTRLAVPSADTSRRPAYRTSALAMLFVLVLCLLLVRPLLIPTSGAGDLGVWLYEIITLFITPAAAFLIGFLLVATPFGQDPSLPSDRTRSTVSAALTCAILAVLLHNLIDFALFEPGVWMAFCTLLACLIALQWRQEPALDSTRHSSPGLGWLAGGIALVLLGVYAHWIWAPVYRMTVGIQSSQQAAAFGRFDPAHAALEEAMKADPLSPAAANLNGRLYLQQSERSQQPAALLEEAARCFREAIARSPADYKNYENLATVYTRMERYQDAYEWYLRAADLYAGCDRLWLELGQSAERLGRNDAALAHYGRAVEIEDSYREQFHRMYPERTKIVSRLGEKEYRLAREQIDRLKKQTPQGPAQPRQ